MKDNKICRSGDGQNTAGFPLREKFLHWLSKSRRLMDQTHHEVKHADLSFLKIYASGNNNLIRQLVNQFLEKTPSSVQQLEEALAQKEYDLLTRVAHSLKSQVSYMGAKRANEMLAEIEDDSRGLKQLELLPEKLALVRELLDQTYTELRQQLSEL
jgi:HPt (histidine-containing phosphotransfer) domain-containing protein